MERRYGVLMEGRTGLRPTRDEEFEEDDVWAIVDKDRKFNSSKVSKSNSTASAPRHIPIPIPNAARRALESKHNTSAAHGSAPVNIPDWSKMYGNKSSHGSPWHDGNHDRGASDDDDDDDGGMRAPHEWIARKFERSKMCSFSVCEGVGRTLKGRDLSKVRNAVLTRTGFLE